MTAQALAIASRFIWTYLGEYRPLLLEQQPIDGLERYGDGDGRFFRRWLYVPSPSRWLGQGHGLGRSTGCSSTRSHRPSRIFVAPFDVLDPGPFWAGSIGSSSLRISSAEWSGRPAHVSALARVDLLFGFFNARRWSPRSRPPCAARVTALVSATPTSHSTSEPAAEDAMPPITSPTAERIAPPARRRSNTRASSAGPQQALLRAF